MYIWRVVATHSLTGRQVASDWFDTRVEAEAVMAQMIADPAYDGYDYTIERKAVSV